MNTNTYFVYIATNKTNSVLYTGVTNDLVRRMYEHRRGTVSRFTKKYNVNKLVYFETFDDINLAIEREKQIKAGSRQKKLDLVLNGNPVFKDLYDEVTK